MGFERTTMNTFVTSAVALLTLIGSEVQAWQPADIATPCGSMGNVIWRRAFYESNDVKLAQDDSSVVMSVNEASGGFISRLSKIDGSDRGTRYFQGINIGRPLIVEPTVGNSFTCIAASDGHVYALDSTFASLWSRDLRRVACSSDAIYLNPCEQLRGLSNATYQDAVPVDQIYVGTVAQCGTTTANRVYALNATTGEIRWVFNGTGSYSVDRITGIVVDFTNNLVIVSTFKQASSGSQNTLLALDAITGRRVWASDVGAIEVRPIIINDAVYVCTTIGTIFKIDPLTGNVVWSDQVLSSGQTFLTSHAAMISIAGLTRLVVATADGRLLAIDDLGSSAVLAWTANDFITTNAQPALGLGVLYAGRNLTDISQLGICSGTRQNLGLLVATPPRSNDSETAMLGSTVLDMLIDSSNLQRQRLIEADEFGVRSFCIPWPKASGTSEDVNNNGTADCLEGSVSSVDASDEAIELLSQNQPNPFDGTTTIRFALARSGSVRLSIVTVAGQTIADLAQGEFEMGRHSLVWDGRDRNGRPVPTGLYLARLQTQDGMATIRMMLMR